MFGDVKMWLRIAACSIAAFFFAMLPARSDIESDMPARLSARDVAIAIVPIGDQSELQNKTIDQNKTTDSAGAEMAPVNKDEIVPVEPEAARQDAAAGVAPPPASPPAELVAPTPAPPPAKLASLEPSEPTITPPSATLPAIVPPAGRSAAEPFGLGAVRVTDGNVLTKWNKVEADIRAGNAILARCRDDMQHCPLAAQNFLAIIAQGREQTGRTRIGVINRAINLAITPMSDLAQWGVLDRWSAPLETFTTGRGDCEDYAIAKYVALTAAGVAPSDVKLVIFRNTEADEDHAVVAVRLDGAWIMLDNRWLTLIADNDMSNAIPRFVLDGDGVQRFVAPALTSTRRTSAPASL
jgi:predicted transglutaminase-like cysteine proteinase